MNEAGPAHGAHQSVVNSGQTKQGNFGRGANVARADQTDPKDEPVGEVLKGLGRGFGGALIFALPLFMTMEMWWLGFYIERSRLVLLLLVNIPLLTVLSRHAGFEKTLHWRDDLRDACIGFGIGLITAGTILSVLAVIKGDMPADEIVGKIALQSVPASIGAVLGSSQLGAHSADLDEQSETRSYLSVLFLMSIGALFLGLNVAPTEEMILISYKMTEWHAVKLVGLSILVMHVFTYALELRGSQRIPINDLWGDFFFFTTTGYAIAILVSVYVLWTFGRTEDTSYTQIVMAATVLGFPTAVGAAAARLIL